MRDENPIDKVIADLNDFFKKNKKPNRAKVRPIHGGGNGYGGGDAPSGGGGARGGGGEAASYKTIASVVIVLAVVIGAFTSFITIQPAEKGVITRFGRYVKTVDEGLHFKMPFGIDKAIKVPISVQSIDFGYREVGTRNTKTSYARSHEDKKLSYMLTGDLNVADVEWKIDYKVVDPWKFLFHSRDPIQNLYDVSISVMRRVIGDRSATAVLTTDRVAAAIEAKDLTQEVIDRYDLGMSIVSLKLQGVSPPEPVIEAFNEVNSAKQEQEKSINNAERQYNKIIPEAEGKAEKVVADAEGYATALVNRAKGDVAQYLALEKEYSKAPEITKRRLYLEMVERVFSNSDNKLTIIDEDIKGVLPVLGNQK